MKRISSNPPYICAVCLRAFSRSQLRPFSATPVPPFRPSAAFAAENDASEQDKTKEGNEGAFSRRLEELGELNIEEGGRSAVKAIDEAGFDAELKERLLEKIASTHPRTEYPQAFAEAELPSSTGKATREIAAAPVWTGEERLADTTLRMLSDSRKPLRVPGKAPGVRGPPKKIDTGRPNKPPSSGVRLATARDQASNYSYIKDQSLSEQEREQLRKEFKARFKAEARPIPATIQGLASLANERIENAIARGQFKNLPRGKKIERDYNASNPFLDTTEYLMNKIIQKQDIVPPWIEKQQELVSTAARFRGRLRADWRRHAARVIASRGGSLEMQVRRAEEYAAAEAIVNPPQRKVETMHSVDSGGHLSQITLSGELKTSPSGDSVKSEKVTVVEDEFNVSELEREARAMVGEGDDTAQTESKHEASVKTDDPRIIGGAIFPFRDPHWEQMEMSYHKLAIEDLNRLTRSYNLMAPDLAKKPYFLLERELRACFADVAPLLKDEILQRATGLKPKIELIDRKSGGVLGSLGGGTAKVYDETRPQYGFKEFWRDVFGSKTRQAQ